MQQYLVMIIKIQNKKQIQLPNIKILEPFEKNTLLFLDTFSKELIKNKKNYKYPEIISFAFWIRKSNLIGLKKKSNLEDTRIGRGLAFHITPSNVTTGFLYSWIFSLISGNSNIVKIPSKNFEQIKLIFNTLKILSSKSNFKSIFKSNKFIKYDSNKEEITAYLSSLSDLRLIWGGDKTVLKLRSFQTPVHALDFNFFDRFSFSLLHLNKQSNYEKISQNFFNDSLVMDQNACSSPHIIVWYKTKKENIELFWKKFGKIVEKKYDLDLGNVYLKFSNEVLNLTKIDNFNFSYKDKNFMTRIKVSKLQENIHEIRGKFGTFIEYDSQNFNFLKKIVNRKFQTLSYEGIDSKKIVNFLKRKNINGVDRIVKLGNALQMSLIWDGFDIPRALSRIIENE